VCADDETRGTRRGEVSDGRYGYELFRRALEEQDQRAWVAVAQIYQGHLVRWARGHRLYRQAGEEAEALANRTLEHLWRWVGPAEFAAFPTLSSLLAYLHRCVGTIVIDHARAHLREQQRVRALQQASMRQPSSTPHGRALDRATERELWAIVRAHCRDEREEWVAYGTLMLGLKPRHVLALAPDRFASTATVNAVLAMLRRRLRRSAVLRRHLMHRPVAASEALRREQVAV
jgi:hypothetical protein